MDGEIGATTEIFFIRCPGRALTPSSCRRSPVPPAAGGDRSLRRKISSPMSSADVEIVNPDPFVLEQMERSVAGAGGGGGEVERQNFFS